MFHKRTAQACQTLALIAGTTTPKGQFVGQKNIVMTKMTSQTKIFALLIFTLTINLVSAQTNIDLSKADPITKTVDSINGAKSFHYIIYKQDGAKWHRTSVSRIFSKDSVLLMEYIKKSNGKGDIATTEFEKITMFDEKRNYKTRKELSANKFLVKRYDSLGKLLSTDKVNRLDLKD